MKTKYIGVSGVARSGKNLFCDIASDILRDEYGMTSRTFSLAEEIKRDCEEFLRTKLNMNIWSEITEEKTIFRPLLIWYGMLKRKQSKGRCWIDTLDPRIRNSGVDVCFVSDVRFAKYANDEAYWIQTELSGKLIHLSKYEMRDFGLKHYTPPASSDETENDPIIQRICDVKVEWLDSHSDVYESARHDSRLISVVREVLTDIM